jgi:hypothetical protein
MTQQSGSNASNNLLLVCLLVVTIFFTAWNEGYLGIIAWPFALVLLAGLGMMVWLALTASPARFLSLVTSIFAVEYIKEALGIYYGFWIYHGHPGSFVFGVWAWVLGGLTCYTLATSGLAPLLRKLPHPTSRRWNSALIVGFALLGVFLMRDRTAQAGWLFWIFYLILTLIALLRAPRFDFPSFFGLVISAWAVGNISEYMGSTWSGIWTFPRDPNYPPLFLLFACWPIEIVAQTSVAALLVPPSDAETSLSPA